MEAVNLIESMRRDDAKRFAHGELMVLLLMVRVQMALGSSIAAVALWLMVGVTVDGECADGAGKQHSSSSVMVGELMVLLWMVSVQMVVGSSIAAW